MALSFRFLFSCLLWIALIGINVKFVWACLRRFNTCSDGNWGRWSPWEKQSCAVSCCGAASMEMRTRECKRPTPVLCGNFLGCPGEEAQTRQNGLCNDIDCPVSCAEVPTSTVFADPCKNSSQFYFQCLDGKSIATKIKCADGLVWVHRIRACFIPL